MKFAEGVTAEQITENYMDMDLLRFTTAGSVDDGKSTLIGRLLYITKSIFEDQLEAIEESSKKRGDEYLNLALLTDGLKAEREQGITIDVAYKYFATPRRKFIIADTPGHVQYTRNMVTGASTANLAIILIDARKGVIEQTKRHAFISSLLQIPHLAVCINKMDLVDFDKDTFYKIREEFRNFAAKLEIKDITFIPISALHGDNVVHRSEKTEWYQGPPLLTHLEEVYIASDQNFIDCRFPVQWVIRPQSKEHPDYRGYAGRVASGIFKKGNDVTVLPSGFTSKIKSIETYDCEIEEALPQTSVTITLEDDIDISRGDMLVRTNNQPTVSQDIEAMVCWLSEKPLNPKGKYALIHTSNHTRCMIKDVHYKIDINTLHRVKDLASVELNEFARITVRTTRPLFFDSYKKNRATGSFILIDEADNSTVGACMIK
ncbi:MAG: sulfate adenylyltransferase subunit CysN [Bacteroidia bacterium]|nr:sulfate adenylyltransferase subunit CysN [Bacteroidia bacterium]